MWRDVNIFNEVGIPAVTFGMPRKSAPDVSQRYVQVRDLVDTAKMYALVARLVTYLDGNLFEDFPQDQQPLEKPDGYSNRVLGHVRPSWMASKHSTPPFAYRWGEVYANLLSLKSSQGDPCDGIRLRYINPYNGGPTLPTFSCEVQLLLPTVKMRTHRHISTAVYYVVQGQGMTTIEDTVFPWNKGDFFLVPPWRWHSHANHSDNDAILFSIDDWPAMAALGIYREVRKE